MFPRPVGMVVAMRAPRLTRAAALVVLAGLGLLLAAPATTQAAATPARDTVLEVDASARLGPLNRRLIGLGWHPDGPTLTTVGELRPRLVRIDAGLEDLSPARGVLHIQPLLDRVAAVRAVGGEPLVILSYMPAWLGAPNAHGRDPTRVPPADADAWEQLIHDVVRAVATAPAPAHRFEAWNEPDIPIFWQDTPKAWADTVSLSARAVARVEAETDLHLAFGGPASAFPDPVYLGVFLQTLRDRSLPLDFVSWHYYANVPFLGPDGNEFPATEPIHPVIGRPNPLASPASYGPQVSAMRDWTDAYLAGSGSPRPELVLDEWNLSSGGFDRRHDTHEGAAFDAGALIEMQHAGLDESAFFQAGDSPPPAGSSTDGYGGHGLVTTSGHRKPAWWTFWLWQRQADERVRVVGADGADGLWAIATRGPGRVTILVASFSASRPTARTLDVELSGLPWKHPAATLRRIDAAHPDAATPAALTVEGSRLGLELPAQAVALIEIGAA